MEKKIKLTIWLLIVISQNLNAQSTISGNIWGLGGNEFIGWDITPTNITPLIIKHELNYPIRFYTDAANGVGLFNRQRMIIDANPGHIGIGLNHAPGNDILDLKPDVNFPNTGLALFNYHDNASATVLHNWGTNNICVGVGAGQAITTSQQNVLLGVNAGNLITTAGGNVIVGYNAGAAITNTGGDNTFVGLKAGMSNTTGDHNSFFGDEAGTSNTTGIKNTFIGGHCGIANLCSFIVSRLFWRGL